MKVVQINTFSYKAAGNIMMNLHNAMINEGIESYVAWGRGRKAENKHEYYMNDDLGVKMHGLYTRITDKHGFASVSSTKKLLKWIDNINPDIIHLHCIHGYYINIELLFNYIKEKNIRVIWTQHDCWAFTGHCAYFDATGCEKWKNGCRNCKQLDTYPSSKIMDNSLWNWNMKKNLFSDLNMTIVTPCHWLSKVIKNSYLGNYQIRVIYNGIDTEIFKHTNSLFKEKYHLEDKKIILGVASEWTERKGLRDLLKLNEILDLDKYKIVIVGVTNKQKKKLKNNIIALNRTENIQELVDIYSASYIYFNPTYEDNFPTTNLEALACGTPVITYKTGGSPECIINKKNGAIVNKGDINNVKSLILNNSFNNKDIFDFNIFSKNSMIRSYISLYNEKNN